MTLPAEPASRHCDAKTRAGGSCRRPAGWGTDHVGYGKCKLHGGSHRNGRKAAKREQATAAVVTYGLPVDVEPHQALLDELHRTAGHVAWLSLQLQALETASGLTERVGGAGGGLASTEPSVWLRLYQGERKHLADVAKTCIQVGIEERRVQLAEQEGQLIAKVLRGVLTELGVMDRPEVPAVVRRHLTMVAGT